MCKFDTNGNFQCVGGWVVSVGVDGCVCMPASRGRVGEPDTSIFQSIKFSPGL